MRSATSAIALAGRLMLAAIFVAEGLSNIPNYADVADYMRAAGVNPRLLPMVILTELGAGLLVATGLFTRWAAMALAGFCLLTAMLFHASWADLSEWIQFQKDVAIAGGFLILAAHGPGDWSFDAWKARRR